MKKLIIAAIIFVLGLTAYAKGEKVTILHKGKVISVSINALKAHLGHGDHLLIFYNDQWMTEEEYLETKEREDLADLEKDYEEVGAESADVEGEEDVEEY